MLASRFTFALACALALLAAAGPARAQEDTPPEAVEMYREAREHYASGRYQEAADALERLGQPEGELALAHAVIYAALAPKSDSVVKALGAAREAAETHADASVPLHVRNAPTGWAKSQGHGAGYRYPHTDAQAGGGQAYLPAPLADLVLYRARPIGDEREVERRWRFWRKHLGRPVEEDER